jgi:AcrR family transcriptional regulator
LSAAAPVRRTRGRPRLEDVAAIESALLAVALREFIAHGYGATSMTRIVRAAGISKTTLYSRFASKEALFRAIMHGQIDQLAAAATLAAGKARPDLEAGLRAYASRALEYSFHSDMLQVNRLVYGEAHRFPELGAAAAEATQIGIGHIRDFIGRCAEADGVPCRDPHSVAEVFIFTLRGWYVNAMLTNHGVPRSEREEWVGRAVRTLVAGREHW